MHIPFGALVPPLPPQSKSITLSSHLSPLIGLFLSCPPSKYWPSYMADCRMTMRSESPVPPSVHVHVHSEKDTIRGGRSGRERTPVAWLSAKPLRLRRRLKPALLENNALVENRDLRRRGLWIFLFASLSLSLKRKKKHTFFCTKKPLYGAETKEDRKDMVQVLQYCNLVSQCASLRSLCRFLSSLGLFLFFLLGFFGGSHCSQRYWLSLPSSSNLWAQVVCSAELQRPAVAMWEGKCGKRSPDYLVS